LSMALSRVALSLPIAVAVGKDVARGMGLQTSDAEFDGDITDIVLDEHGEHLHFGERRRHGRGEFGDLLLDFRGRIAAALGEVGLPLGHFRPTEETFFLRVAGRKEGDQHLPFNAAQWRHIVFDADGLDVGNEPLRLVGRRTKRASLREN